MLARRRRLSALLTLLVSLLAIAVVACGGDGSGSFVGTASNAAVYVTWTRADDTLSGQLTQAMLPDDVDEEVSTTRVGFSGTIDGDAVSLKLEQGLGTSTTLTGALDGDQLTLEYPGDDGVVTVVRLRLADAQTFNRELGALRARAADNQQAAADQAAAEEAASDAYFAADAAHTGIDTLTEAAGNATASNPHLHESDLDTIRGSLDTVNSSYDVLNSSVENGYTDTICDDARVVADDVEVMRNDIATMRRDVRQGTDVSQIDDEIASLRSTFEAMQSFDAGLLPADAPTASDVEGAIKAARRTIRRAGGADFDAADELLDQAEATQADAACRRAAG